MQKIYRHLIGIVILTGFIISILASATTHQTQAKPQKLAPGLYGGVNRWNGGQTDINGEVGHTLYVSGLTARCINCFGCGNGTWSANHVIVSGSFPPGVSWDPSGGSGITGIPTERGHWIVSLKAYDITCNNLNYDGSCGFTQELHFHITGSGAVH